ncbi:MAG: NAD(P)-dependent alcohol dehydrogenase [Proteobacteria bacterium]|nr:MAG: NAD(P)-dependent alcohol dehydrogenase [Pseudomonadota bacterium]
MKINAAILEEKSGSFKFKNIEIGEIRPDEVLVRVVASGICHTDSHVRLHPEGSQLPLILGHEGSGVIEKLGIGVQGLEVGDHVIMSYPLCGHCDNCQGGHPAYCVHNMQLSFGGARLDGSNAYEKGVHGHFFGQSSFATYSIASESNVIKIPKDVPLELMGPLGCGFQTGAGAVLNALKVEAGKSIVVLGSGAVGIAAIMAAKIAGASSIIAVDVNDDRLNLALELGATHKINGSNEDTKKRIQEILPKAPDYIIELTGRPNMLTMATEVISQLGTVALIAASAPGTQAPIDMMTLLNGRIIKGIVQGDSISKLFLPKLIDFYKAGKFPFDRLVKFYDFKDIEQAFEDTKSGVTIKPILRIGKV